MYMLPFTDLPPVFAALHASLGEEVVRATTIEAPGYNFSRVTASPDELNRAFGDLQTTLGAIELGIPVAFKRSTTRPENPLVSTLMGHGFSGDSTTNPNPAGMGLVTSVPGCGLAVTYADAPSLTAVYAPPS